VAGAIVVDHEVNAGPGTDVLQDVHAQIEVRERGGLGDLQIDLAFVKKQRIIRPHQPPLTQLFRVHVHEQRRILTTLERLLANDAAQVTTSILLLGRQK